MRYDAFISYRHGGLDGLVAEKLHKLLETYRIPRQIAKKVGKKKLSRVFRDREELPTSSNLSDSINYALENSSFLLLICSKRTCGSQWVMREVERFGDLHGKDRIITLLIEGEPDESFPPGLREREVDGELIFVEPLAADIRAETWAGSIKLLKEEKLRLLSPILGCAFDDLRRRHRRRRIQRIASVVGAGFAFTLSFGAFSTWQYIRIDREMQLKLENQSYVLAEYAADELRDGDPETALLLALAALPKDLSNPDRPLVPAAEMALSDAMGVYDATDGFKPYKSLELQTAPGKVLLSPQEGRAAAVYPFELALFDTQSGTETARLPTVRSALADAEFLSEDVIVFAGEDGLMAYDAARGETLWSGLPATAVAVSKDGGLIAAVYKDGEEALLYSPDGTRLGEISFKGKNMPVPANDSVVNPHDSVFELSADGGVLAVSFSDGSLSLFETDGAGETELYPSSAAIHFAGGFYGDAFIFSVVENGPYYSALAVYDLKSGGFISSYESDTSPFVPYAGEDGAYFAIEDQVYYVDVNSGEVALAASAGGRIETFKKSGDTFIVCENGGTYRFIGGDLRIYESGYTCNFADIGGDFALTGGYDSKTVRLLRAQDLSAENIMEYDTDYSFSEARINPAGDRVAFYSYNGLRLCDIGGNTVAEVQFPEPSLVVDTQYDKQSGNVAVIYKDALLLYSGTDASLLLEARGRADSDSVVYTDFGVCVLGEDGRATLYDLATGSAAADAAASGGAQRALIIAGELLEVRDGRVFFGGGDLGEGGFIGAGKTGGDEYSFAISDGTGGKVFVISGGELKESFSFEALGRTEAYFTGGFVFISPIHGSAAAYTPQGGLVRQFDLSGFMSETGTMGEYIVAGYVSASSERYSYLLRPDTLETMAYLPGFLGETNGETLVLDGGGHLRGAKLRGTAELIDMAREKLAGKELSPDEIKSFKAG